MANVPISNLTTTWNNVSTTFTGIKLNVTDTASAAGSLLIDLQVGGSSKFKVSKTGEVSWSTFTGSLTSRGVECSPTSSFLLLNDATPRVVFGGSVLKNASLSLGTSEVLQEAANTLAQRNGVNAQTFRLYNTFTDASNYERGFMRWNTNVLEIGTEKAGTGSARNLQFLVDGSARLNYGVSASGEWTFVGSVNTNGSFTSGAGFGFAVSGRSIIKSPATGVVTLFNSGENDFNRLQLGGTTSSFPALKRSTTALQARLADDSAFTNIQGKLTTEANYTAGDPTTTGYLVLYDAAGTAYKVPAVAL